jgi:hypothetical protein
MSAHDLASLFTPDNGGSTSIGEGTVLTWDSASGENEIQWRNTKLRNVHVLDSTRPMLLRTGDRVLLLGWSPTGRGIGTWIILGRVFKPGGTEDGVAMYDTLSAREVNADRLNADEIFVDGRELSTFVEDMISAQVPESDPDPPPVGESKLIRTYNAIWSANYRSSNARNSFDERPHQGFWSSTNGNQRSLIGFSTSAINAM